MVVVDVVVVVVVVVVVLLVVVARLLLLLLPVLLVLDLLVGVTRLRWETLNTHTNFSTLTRAVFARCRARQHLHARTCSRARQAMASTDDVPTIVRVRLGAVYSDAGRYEARAHARVAICLRSPHIVRSFRSFVPFVKKRNLTKI